MGQSDDSTEVLPIYHRPPAILDDSPPVSRTLPGSKNVGENAAKGTIRRSHDSLSTLRLETLQSTMTRTIQEGVSRLIEEQQVNFTNQQTSMSSAMGHVVQTVEDLAVQQREISHGISALELKVEDLLQASKRLLASRSTGHEVYSSGSNLPMTPGVFSAARSASSKKRASSPTGPGPLPKIRF